MTGPGVVLALLSTVYRLEFRPHTDMSDHVSMRKLRAGWLGVAFAFVVLAAGAAWLGTFLSRRGLDEAAKFSEIASFFLAAGAVLLPAAGKVVRWLPAPRLKDEQIDSDVADLAAALRIQGRSEGGLSAVYVYDRLPMPVRWQEAEELSSGSRPHAPDANLANQAEDLTGTFDEVLEYFRQLPESRLVVLGPAGAGKTVLATELARRLLVARQPDDPVPVIIPAAAWDPRQTALFDWVAEQLIRINSGLAQRVSDGRRVITRAQALVDRMKVLPILDGLDEVTKASRPMATLAINQYGWSQPLVMTCRTDEYLRIIGIEHGTPVARAAVVQLMPLELADIKGYLGPNWDGHWTAMYDRLDAEPRGALAEALANPLMLWLAWAVYSNAGRSPAELADTRRFASRAAIEHHLLAEFVPAVYRDSKDLSTGSLERLLPASRSSERRWLGFLASDAYLHKKTPGRSGRASLDIFETRDLQNVAWWRFTGAARSLRVLGVFIRGALLLAVLWELIVIVLSHNGNRRYGAYVGFRKAFFSGPLGQSVWPTIRQLILLVPKETRQHAYSVVSGIPQYIVDPPASAVFSAVLLILFFGTFAAYSEAERPSYLHIRPRLPISWLASSLPNLIVVAGAMWFVIVYWHHSYFVATFFGQRSTWFTVLAISLAMSVPGWPRKLVAKTDVVGAVSPIESFRLDRWADVVVTSSRRAIFAVVVALFSGPQLALAYIAFAVACTGVALVLGGRTSNFASRSYTDACIWLTITRRMPWRPMRFLADAEHRGVFLEVGAIFRFRHARVQLQLRDWYDAYRPPGARGWWLRYLRLIDQLQARTGDRTYSLAGARHRVNGLRKLAAQNSGGFGADLSKALSDQAGLLRELGYRDDELEALRELVITSRRLTETDAEASPDLAESLRQVALRLADAGRDDEALELMTEAAEICLQLAQAEPETYLGHLRDLLTSLIQITEKLERPDGAAHGFNTVVDSYRDLVRVELDRDRVSHMTSLTWLVRLLNRLGREDDAAAEVNTAVKAYAEQPRAGPDTDPAGYAESLAALAEILEALERKDDAARAITDSADIYRELARLEPAKYRPLLVESLSRLATLCQKMNRPEELSAITEAVSVYREVATEANLYDQDEPGVAASPRLAPNSPVAAPGLSPSKLSSLALRLWKLGAKREAVEAVTIGDQIAGVGAQQAPLRMLWVGLTFSDQPSPPMRPDSLSIFSWLARVMGDKSWEQARAKGWRSLADEHDVRAFRLLLAGQGQESQAEAVEAADCCRKLVAVYRHLVITEPADYLADLADSLDLLAIQLRKAGSGEEEAKAAASEAQLIRRRLGLERAQSVTDTSRERPPPQVAED